ncbi:MAG: TetR/AcrR family transcriptional regulator [Anaerolineaceae bacterium]|nr:TetR/AcrR family transcriptional regulator [Anaerolineaceae bacterium]
MVGSRTGTGRTHNAQAARDAILNAAEKVFAEHGFDGARIDDIAVVSSYNKGLLFRYFGNKLDLYTAVIRRANEQTRTLQEQAIAPLLDRTSALDVDSVRDLLKIYLRAYYDYLLAHPLIARIYVWEMAEGWKTYAKIASKPDFEEVHQLRPLLSKLQNAGLLRVDLDPIFQIIAAEAYSLTYLACLPLAQLFSAGEDFTSPEALARGREYNAEFVSQGLIIDRANK